VFRNVCRTVLNPGEKSCVESKRALKQMVQLRLLKLIGLLDHVTHSVFCRHQVVAAGSKGAVFQQEGEHFLGMFSQESVAARACDVAALKLHGASAQTNFPVRSDPCSLG